MSSPAAHLPGLLLCLLLGAWPAAADSPAPSAASPGGKHYQQADTILRAYAKAGKPDTEDGRRQLREAQVHLDEALKSEPDNPYFLYVQGQVLEYLGEGPAALQAYQRSYEIQPHIQPAAAIGALAVELGEHDEAIRVLNASLVGAEPGKMTSALTGRLAIAYLLDGQAAQAQRLADDMIRHDHTLFTTALVAAINAVADDAVPAPVDAQDMRRMVQTFYGVVLERDPIPHSLDERTWKLGHEDENERQYVREYFLPGESPGDWTEMVTLQVLKQARGSPHEFAEMLRQITLKTCPDTQWKTLSAAESPAPAVQVEWQTSGKCSQLHQQYETAKLLQLREGVLARIAYVTRGRSPHSDARQQWVQRIGELSLEHLREPPARSPDGG